MVNNSRVTYAITVCNEHAELDRLLHSIVNTSGIQRNNILIQFDTNRVTYDVRGVIDKYSTICESSNIKYDVIDFEFNGDFSKMKNNLLSRCTGDYVFQLDADEEIGDGLLNHINELLDENSKFDVIIIPRINVVNGITNEYIQEMGWVAGNIPFPRFIDDLIINYPDHQYRIFKNVSYIHYNSAVHESIVGFKSYAIIEPPKYEVEIGEMTHDEYYKFIQDWSLIHVKEFDKQISQNNLYATLSN